MNLLDSFVRVSALDVEHTGELVALSIELALAREERFEEAVACAVVFAQQGLRAARILGLYSDEGAA